MCEITALFLRVLAVGRVSRSTEDVYKPLFAMEAAQRAASDDRAFLHIRLTNKYSITGPTLRVDYLTGYEVTVWPFYSIPILLMIWFGDRKLAVLFSVLSTFAWWWVDKASGHSYSSEWLRVWDAIVRLMFFCLVMFAASTFKDQRDASRVRIETYRARIKQKMDFQTAVELQHFAIRWVRDRE